MRLALALVLVTLGALPLQAQSPLTPEEFEAYAQGRTLTYSYQGEVFGIEEYLPGRRVRWAFAGFECTDGYWYDDRGQVCFVYDYDPTPQCWTFFRDGAGIIARFMADPPGTELSEVAQSEVPLACPGPDVGA